MATSVVTAGLFLAALYTKSSQNANILIRNLAIGVVGSIIVQLFLVLLMVFVWNF